LRINCGENWVIRGPNGAGKSTLARTLLGQTAVVAGTMRRYPLPSRENGDRLPSLALVSSEQYHHLYAQEQNRAEMRSFSGRIHEVTRAADAMGLPLCGEKTSQLIAALPEIKRLAEKPVAALSSGEMRKLLIFRALSIQPDLLILDEPFNGLDASARKALAKLLHRLHDSGTQMVLITHRRADISDFFTHELYLKKGCAANQGRIATQHRDLPADDDPLDESHAVSPASAIPPDPNGPTDHPMGDVLIRMRDVTVRYKDTIVLDKVSWEVKRGENWAVIGPNGAGKTTLLKLITGDNLQGYANELVLFGRPKGTGESVWQIRQQIGYVADDLQANYQRNLAGVDVVCSGFFDSMGLYTLTTQKQRRTALDWMATLEIDELAHQPVNRLSFGQQRLLLIARAMVKTPLLLILDEPCNGLDPVHRRQVLAVLDRIAGSGGTNLLYVTHRREEMPDCITHCLHLAAGRVIEIPKDQLAG